MSSPEVWLLSAYAAASHRIWADHVIADQPDFDWRRYELPPRHFRWRIRGNPLGWLDRLPVRPPELIIATSMVDLATLRGLRPDLGSVPTIYYFHENQFAYPAGARQADSLEPQFVQLYGALSADRLLFNSAFNRDSFLDGCHRTLQRRPDCVPNGVTARLAERSTILPVPIDRIAPAGEHDPGLILWNHRWEYDKAPERFSAATIELARRGHDFRLALLGPRPTNPPQALAELRWHLGERIVVDGHLAAADYRSVAARAGIVVSTTRHEFQGLAMLEATSAGARPLAPDSLCYPEQYPAAYRYPDGDQEALIERLGHWLSDGLPPAVNVEAWSRGRLASEWTRALKEPLTAGACRGAGMR